MTDEDSRVAGYDPLIAVVLGRPRYVVIVLLIITKNSYLLTGPPTSAALIEHTTFHVHNRNFDVDDSHSHNWTSDMNSFSS